MTEGSLIAVDNVVKVYDTGEIPFTALRGVNLHVKTGEFVGLIGKSGSGKTTLVNMITGIDRPTSGEVNVHGTPVHALNENQLAMWRGRTIGVVFQFFQLLPTLTVIENVMLPMDFCNMYTPGERPIRAMALLEEVEMADQAFKLPSALSGGQQQRVAIARALANDPPILAADEPTGNLDSKTADAVFGLFEKLVDEGKTIVMVTHDSDMAARVRRALHVHDGEIVEEVTNRARSEALPAAGRGPANRASAGCELDAMKLSPRWRKVLSDLTSNKSRTILVVLSIAVGVFAIAVVMGGRGVLLREFDEDYAASRPPDAEYATSDFDEGQLHEVQRQPDISLAEGRRRLSLRFTADENPAESTAGWSTIRLWALSSFEEMQISRVTPEKGAEWPPGPGVVILERSALQADDYEVNDVLTVETSAGEHTQLRVGGFAHDINAFPTTFTGTVIGYIAMDALADLDEPTDFNSLSVVFAQDGLTRFKASRLAADLRDDVLVPMGIQVYNMSVPEPGSHFLGDIFKAVSLLLLALGVLSLALSAFLVINTISAIMAQQVRQVGIMKSVGGRARQIMAMYLTLVGIYGLLAVAVALPIGWIAGRWFIQYAADMLNFQVTSYIPPSYVVALEIAVGLVVPLLAALVPVRLGSRVTVVKALNASGISSASFGHGIVDRVLGVVRGLPRPVALSLRNTFLRKGRLVLTLFTLTLASAVVMGTLSVRASILQTITDIGAWWNYDAQVSFARPKPAEEVERIAKGVPGVTGVETWVESGVSYQRDDGSENESIFAIGLPPTTRFITPTLAAGRWLEEGDDDEIVVNTDISKDEAQMRVGNTVRLKIYGDERNYKVVGVVSGQLMGPTVFMDKQQLDSITQSAGGVTRLLVTTESHTGTAQDTVATELERRLDDADITPTGSETQTGMRDRLASELNILVTFLVIMAALLAAVGVIGLTGTMTINVLESVREIGVMRAIGASHASIFGIFITEGVVVGLMAWGLGAIASWPISLLLTNALSSAMNLPLTYVFSFAGVGIWLVSVLVIAVIASLLPSWRASQVSVRDAIAYE